MGLVSKIMLEIHALGFHKICKISYVSLVLRNSLMFYVNSVIFNGLIVSKCCRGGQILCEDSLSLEYTCDGMKM